MCAQQWRGLRNGKCKTCATDHTTKVEKAARKMATEVKKTGMKKENRMGGEKDLQERTTYQKKTGKWPRKKHRETRTPPEKKKVPNLRKVELGREGSKKAC